MNRYRISETQFPIVKKYLAGKATNKVPSWAKKFHTHLSVKKGKIYYEDKEVIPKERIGKYLRGIFYTKGETVPLSRDGAFHILKQRPVIGVSRRAIMDFLKAQEPVEQGRAALPERKKAGVKLKNYTIETDLIFIRRPDLEAANPRFKKSYPFEKAETYIVSVCEKITGVCRISHVTTKDPKVVGPVVIKHVKDICRQLGVKPKTVDLASDSGGEFRPQYLSKFVKSYTAVKLGSSIEKKNQDIQRTMFQLFRTRRALNIKDALEQTQSIVNNNYNRIQKKTPNEAAVDEEKESKVKYNAKRQQASTLDKRVINVGDYVRVLIKKKKETVGFKSYKGKTWSKEVYTVKKKTKNAAVPKYYVNRKWLTSDSLLVTKPPDVKSRELIQKRDKQTEKADEKSDKRHLSARMEAVVQPERKPKPLRRSARLAGPPPRRSARLAGPPLRRSPRIAGTQPLAVARPPRRAPKPESKRPTRSSARTGRIQALKRMQEERKLAKLIEEMD